jgi:hypothetical protein
MEVSGEFSLTFDERLEESKEANGARMSGQRP